MPMKWEDGIIVSGFSVEQKKAFNKSCDNLGLINDLLFHDNFDDDLGLKKQSQIVFLGLNGTRKISEQIKKIREKIPDTYINVVFDKEDFKSLKEAYSQEVEGIIFGDITTEKIHKQILQMVEMKERKAIEFGLLPYEQILQLFSSPIKVKNEDELFDLLFDYFNAFEAISGFALIDQNKQDSKVKILQGKGDTLSEKQCEAFLEKVELPKLFIGKTFEFKLGESLWVFVPYSFYRESTKYILIKFKNKQDVNILNRYFFLYLQNLHLYRYSKEKVNVLTKLANTDEVTGLYNSRKLSEDLKAEMEMYEKSHTPFSIMFIDVDRFKEVNDNFGHVVGSKLLLQIGELAALVLRDSDKVYRYGGDEFVVIMPNVEASTVYKIALRIQERVKHHAFDVGTGEPYFLTLSIGIGEYPKDAKTSSEIIQFADEMMYKSKKSGRGKIFHVNEVKDQ